MNPPPSDDEVSAISPEVMAELLRRREELAEGSVKIISMEELDAGMSEAIREIRGRR